MARPYRRKRGKRYVGNFRQPLPGGGDRNLQTTDANEATRRGRVVLRAYAKGDRGDALDRAWSSEAAAATASAASDPSREAEAAEAAEAADEGDEGSEPEGQGSTPSPPAPPAAPVTPAGGAGAGVTPSAPDLDEAARAAAAEAIGEDADGAVEVIAPASARARFDAMVRGAKGAESLAAMLADLAAAAAIWGGTKGAELGWDLLLSKWTRKRLQAGGVPPSDDWSREFTRVSITVAVEESFPKLLDKVTPGWGVLLGVLAGVGVSVSQGRLVSIDTGAAKPVSEIMKEATAAAAAMANGAAAAPPAASSPPT
jgi:hypothetical protein